MVKQKEAIMKKVLTIILLVLIAMAVFTACNDNSSTSSSSDNDNNSQIPTIESLSIECDVTEIEAGSSFEIKITANEDLDLTAENDVEITFISGWDYASYNKGRIYIDSDAPNNAELEFYAEYKNVRSEAIIVTITNIRNQIQNQINQLQQELSELQAEYDSISNQCTQALNARQQAENNYYNYQRQCIANGFLTSSGGSWKVEPTHYARIESDRLYSLWMEQSRKYSSLLSQRDSINREMSSVRNEIEELQEQLLGE